MAPTSPATQVTLGTFEGEMDPVAGTLVVRSTGVPPVGGAPRAALVIPEGSSGVTIANNGTPVKEDGAGTCAGYTVLSAPVRITLGGSNGGFAGGLYAEIRTITGTGGEGCNSSAAPSGLDATKGLWSYGTVRPGATTADVTWKMKVTSAQPTAFTGRIVGVPGTTFTAGLPSPSGGGAQVRIALAREGMVYASNAASIAYVSLAGASQGSVALGTGQDATSLAFRAGSSSADDLLWFTTDGYVGVVHQGQVHKKDVGATGLTSIADDPTTNRRAWFLTRDGAWFGSVTFDPAATTKLTLGTPVATPSQPYSLVFGPAPNRWIYVSSNRNFTGSASFIQAWNTNGTYQGALDLANSACPDPYQLLLGPDGKLWFGYSYDDANGGGRGVCVHDFGTGTYTRVTTDGKLSELGIGKSVTGAGNVVWGAYQDWPSLIVHYVELVEGGTAFFQVEVADSGGFGPAVAGSPAVAGDTPYDAFVWGTSAGGLRRLQP